MYAKGGRKHPDQKFIEVNTEKYFVYCGGAFDGIGKGTSPKQVLNMQAVGYSASKAEEKVDNNNISTIT